MFAPPPVQFSRTEIKNRLAGHRTTVKSNESPDGILRKSTSLRRSDTRSPTSPFKIRFLSKADKSQASSPVATGSPTSPPEKQTKFEVENILTLPAGFAEHPRQAPAPPKRAAPTPNTNILPSPPKSGVYSTLRNSAQESSSKDDTAPPIPPKSSRRPILARPVRETAQALHQDAPGANVASYAVIAEAKLEDDVAVSPFTPYNGPRRALTTTSTTIRNHSRPVASQSYGKTPSVRSTSSVAQNHRNTPSLEMGTSNVHREDATNSSRPNDSAVSSQALNVGRSDHFAFELPGEVQYLPAPAAINVKLGDAATHIGQQFRAKGPRDVAPVSNLDARKTKLQMRNKNITPLFAKDAPHLLKFVHKELPATPTSIVFTPTEMYENTQKSSPTALRKSQSPKAETLERSPLRQVSTKDAKVNSSIIAGGDASLNGLSAILENTARGAKPRRASGPMVPVATRMHLRDGSLITVSPPELTPWQCSLYTQGPIRLPISVIVPRKNSVASLEPFQDAIDEIYQGALSIPRRRSDDRVLDDICDFFDDFGFEEITYRGDVLVSKDLHAEDIGEIERFTTPPAEPRASPAEMKMAKDFFESSKVREKTIATLSTDPLGVENIDKSRGAVNAGDRTRTRLSAASHQRRDSVTLTTSIRA